MNITKAILDDKVKTHETGIKHDKTFREWIRDLEDEFNIEHEDLDNMTDEELDRYDTWLFEISWK
ncbi:MAG TPA: hypothetical protein DDY58_16240 [Terrisporobacter glycolicus]|uniref:hypothetical protein n=1 Tax=Terrisporobacter TaxID=1505652 RepID=UPI000E85CF88|nr:MULTISPECIES: hypothetical protein [Terrisporobacter]HBI93842.1 hypothetical protein [Terrisporobacter hibernicus]